MQNWQNNPSGNSHILLNNNKTWMFSHHCKWKFYCFERAQNLGNTTYSFFIKRNMIKCFCPTFSKGCCFSLRPMQCVNRVVLTFVNFSIAVPTKQWWSLQWGMKFYEAAFRFWLFYKNMRKKQAVSLIEIILFPNFTLWEYRIASFK